RTALTNAGIVGAAEALSQPFTYRFKKEIGSEYSVGEAVRDVAAAAAGAGILTGGIKAAEVGIGKLLKPRVHGVDDMLESFDRNDKPTTLERDAAFVLGDYANVVRESPFHLNDPAAGEAHFQAVGKATGDMLDNKAASLSRVVGLTFLSKLSSMSS